MSIKSDIKKNTKSNNKIPISIMDMGIFCTPSMNANVDGYYISIIQNSGNGHINFYAVSDLRGVTPPQKSSTASTHPDRVFHTITHYGHWEQLGVGYPDRDTGVITPRFLADHNKWYEGIIIFIRDNGNMNNTDAYINYGTPEMTDISYGYVRLVAAILPDGWLSPADNCNETYNYDGVTPGSHKFNSTPGLYMADEPTRISQWGTMEFIGSGLDARGVLLRGHIAQDLAVLIG